MLQKICHKEHVKAEFRALERIAENSGGDVRSAINDLQSLAETSKTLTLQDTIGLSLRNKDVGMEETLRSISQRSRFWRPRCCLSRSSVDYDDLLMAILAIICLFGTHLLMSLR